MDKLENIDKRPSHSSIWNSSGGFVGTLCKPGVVDTLSVVRKSVKCNSKARKARTLGYGFSG
jgi:hypothetical protein